MRRILTFMSLFLGLLSLVLFQINEVLSSYGLLIYLTAIILVCFFRISWIKRIGVIITYLLIGLIAHVIGLSTFGHKYYDRYYFSENLNGQVRVLFDREIGIKPERLGKNFIIPIDNDITIVHREKEAIYSFPEYFLVDKDGKLIKLEVIDKVEEFEYKPSIIVKNQRYWENYKLNVCDFVIIKEMNEFLDKTASLDSLTIILLNKHKTQ